MSELFSDEWMTNFQTVRNAKTGIAGELEKNRFKSIFGYGFKGDEKPLGAIVVDGEKGISAGAYNGEELNWDLRADKPTWEKWNTNPPGMMGLGMAYISKKLQFLVGDYGAMMKVPRIAGPFIRNFATMGKA